MGGAKAERSDGLGRPLRVGERVTDRLMADDRRRTAALLRLGKIQRPLEGRTHQPDGEDADDRRGACEAGFDERLAPTARPDQAIAGPAQVVLPDLRVPRRAGAGGSTT